MTPIPDARHPIPSTAAPTSEPGGLAANSNGAGGDSKSSNGQPIAALESSVEQGVERAIPESTSTIARTAAKAEHTQTFQGAVPASLPAIVLMAIVIMIGGLVINSSWLGIAGAVVALVVSLRLVWGSVRNMMAKLMAEPMIVSIMGISLAAICLLKFSGIVDRLGSLYAGPNWDAIGASGEVFGALGQILIAILAVYVAWRQYVISKDLTIQQNLITQQQTIDSYFQGISELVLDSEGLLEDWPQERAIAEGRTAAILSSIDAGGKAKVIRFLSRSRLISPLKRDRILGRAILDGDGGYEEDRNFGIRVIDLGVMLAGANLAGTDLRWTDMSDVNLIRANLKGCDLVKANLVRAILFEANLAGADLMGVRLFYGTPATATPRSRTEVPNYATGAHTGAVVEQADLTGVQRMSDDQRYYCCAWGGSKTRATIPGGCEGIPNRLGR